jgi:choline dehydrogenase
MRRVIAQHPLAEHAVVETSPGPPVGNSDEELLAHARMAGNSGMHPTSTCRMGLDADALLDPQLRVRACRRLRVVDAAAMPDLPGANTNAPTMALAEKAAEIIRRGI